jgi:RNAse (barnase) inhibitor barstar
MNIEAFLRADPPHLHEFQGPTEALEAILRAMSLQDGAVVRRLRGRKMRTALFYEFSSALQFPSYFGENWNALDECLHDLEWLPARAILLVISEADELLSDRADEDLRIILEILSSVADGLADPSGIQGMPPRAGIPFHVLFQREKSPTVSRIRVLLQEMNLEYRDI